MLLQMIKYLNEFNKWLFENGHTQYLKKMNVKVQLSCTELKIVLIKMVNQKNNVVMDYQMERDAETYNKFRYKFL